MGALVGAVGGLPPWAWRLIAYAVIAASLFGAGALWEGERAAKRLEAYKALVEAAADKQAIRAGLTNVQSGKILQEISGGLRNELASTQARYDLYRSANPQRLRERAADGVGTVPGIPASGPGDADPTPERRFIGALEGCENTRAQVRAWQTWYAQESKNWGASSSPSR